MAWNLPLPSAGGYNRHGLYNDCFLTGKTDTGTYKESSDDIAKQRAYASRNSATAPYGGETCEDIEKISRNSCEDIDREGKEFHLSYLNDAFSLNFINQWKDDKCFDDVERNMGYRIFVQSASAWRLISQGKSASITIVLQNVGWARVFNERKTEVVLTAGTTKYTVPMNGLRNRVFADGKPVSFTVTWNVPSNAPRATYEISVVSKDSSPALEGDQKYNLRFANDDSEWDESTGMVNLGISIRVL